VDGVVHGLLKDKHSWELGKICDCRMRRNSLLSRWLGGLVVRKLDSQCAVMGSISGDDTARLFVRSFIGKLSWDITTTQVNSDFLRDR